jgi:putative AlgH/UPF0301 family transcriptional regulator
MAESYQTGRNTKANSLLVALPRLDGSAFERTVIWLWQDNVRSGSQGVVLNRPSMVNTDQIIEEMGYTVLSGTAGVIHHGGPVSERSISMLHSTEWYSTNTHVWDSIAISSDLFMLEKMAAGNTPLHWRLFAGKSAWAQGQLDREIAEGYWFNTTAEADIVFSERNGVKLWEDTVEHMGRKVVQQWF